MEECKMKNSNNTNPLWFPLRLWQLRQSGCAESKRRVGKYTDNQQSCANMRTLVIYVNIEQISKDLGDSFRVYVNIGVWYIYIMHLWQNITNNWMDWVEMSSSFIYFHIFIK